jgi:hypothetical protein
MHKENNLGPIYPPQIQTLLTSLDVDMAYSKAKLKIDGYNRATHIEHKPGWRSQCSDEATGWEIRLSTSGRERDLCLFPNVQTFSGAHLASYSMDTGSSFPSSAAGALG